MYITSATPNKRSLGATNGFAQTVAAVQRTAAPATADWLFAFSISNNVLGGKLYICCITHHGVRRAVDLCEASETLVDA
jgi:hypothetical protein